MSVTATRLTGDQAQTSTGLTGAQTQLLGLQEWEINFTQAMPDATTSDDQGWETRLASLKSWKATAKYAYIDGDTSQQAAIMASVTGAQNAVQWNFFSLGAVGRDVWHGMAFVSSCKITSGLKKIVALDITLEGTGALLRSAQLAPSGGVDEE